MAVGKQSYTAVTVSLTDSGAVARTITSFLMQMGGAKINVAMQDSTAFGDAWTKMNPTGMRTASPIPVSGDFDTTATTGPHVVLNPVDADVLPNATARTLVIVFGDSKTFTVSVRISDYEVIATTGKLSSFKATLTPTGAAVWS
jgi:hypothetical protein